MTNKGKDAQLGYNRFNLSVKPAEQPEADQRRCWRLSDRCRNLWIGGLSVALALLIAIVLIVAIADGTQRAHAVKKLTRHHVGAHSVCKLGFVTLDKLHALGRSEPQARLVGPESFTYLV